MNDSEYFLKIEKLEAELERERREKHFHKDNAKALMFHAFPCLPLTPEEEARLMTDVGGEPILKILAEYEQKVR